MLKTNSDSMDVEINSGVPRTESRRGIFLEKALQKDKNSGKSLELEKY